MNFILWHLFYYSKLEHEYGLKISQILVFLPIITQPEEEKNNGKDENYELSLVGVLLMLAIMSLKRWEESRSYFDCYNTIASNYQEKLPLIFGKWGLLEKTLDFGAYPSIFDYLLGDYKSQVLSLSLSLGGNKEIYDNIRSATLTKSINSLWSIMVAFLHYNLFILKNF